MGGRGGKPAAGRSGGMEMGNGVDGVGGREETQTGEGMEKQEVVMSVAPENRRGGDSSRTVS